MDEITLTAATQTALRSTQRLAQQTERTQDRLSTGRRVNSPVDDPVTFFAAKSLLDRAGDLSTVKEDIGQAVSAVGATIVGVNAIEGLVSQARATALSAQGGTVAERDAAAARFDEIRNQINNLAADVSYGGVNLISQTPDNLTVQVNETGGGTVTISGSASDSASLGIGDAASNNSFASDADIANAVAQLDGAVSTLRSTASGLASDVGVLQVREDFTRNLTNTLQSGAANLTDADINEEAANLLSLQVRSQLSLVSQSIASENDQAILRLF